MLSIEPPNSFIQKIGKWHSHWWTILYFWFCQTKHKLWRYHEMPFGGTTMACGNWPSTNFTKAVGVAVHKVSKQMGHSAVRSWKRKGENQWIADSCTSCTSRVLHQSCWLPPLVHILLHLWWNNMPKQELMDNFEVMNKNSGQSPWTIHGQVLDSCSHTIQIPTVLTNSCQKGSQQIIEPRNLLLCLKLQLKTEALR